MSAPLLAERLVCQPETKFACDEESCGRETEGFQHAERFVVDTAVPWLEACLWTSCYAGVGVAFRSGDGQETTIVGRLVSSGDPGMYPPRVVSVTLDAAGGFVAVWGYGARGLVFDQGQCRAQADASR